MNQPKFKMGDVVEVIVKDPDDGETIFEITQIHKYGDNFNYSNGHIDGYFQEDHIALKKEPQKKKLHAHTVKVHTIGGGYFFEYKFIHPGTPTPSEWSRAPDYDIEYPEAK